MAAVLVQLLGGGAGGAILTLGVIVFLWGLAVIGIGVSVATGSSPEAGVGAYFVANLAVGLWVVAVGAILGILSGNLCAAAVLIIAVVIFVWLATD